MIKLTGMQTTIHLVHSTQAFTKFWIASTNHNCVQVSLVGWGRDDDTGKRFWVGRNSWGTYWGEMGFFRIAMGEDNNGIENACVWAVPKV